MENKLTNYNQKLLAIIGTLVLAGLGFSLISGGYFLITEMIRDMRRGNEDNALVVNDQDKKGEEGPKVRVQEISFLNPMLIDTLKEVYLIPVSQVNLKDPEIVEGDVSYDKLGVSSRKYSHYRYSGSYNNIIIYTPKNDRKVAVFTSKVNINSFENYVIHDRQYLFIKGTVHDSNKDGRFDDADLQTFFIYDIQNEKLQPVEFENMGLVDYSILYNTDQVILRFGRDKDQDGEFGEYLEPVYLKKYSISEGKTIDLIEDDQLAKLQGVIE